MSWSPRYDLYGDLLRQQMITRFGTARFRHPKLHGLAMSADGRFVASGAEDGTLVVWKASTGKRLFSVDVGEAVHAVAFHPTERLLVSGGADGVLRVWDLVSTQPRQELTGHEDEIYDVAFSRDGTRVASGGGGHGRSADRWARLWDLDGGDLLHDLVGSRSDIRSVRFSPDGTRLAVAGGRTSRIYDVESGERVHQMKSEHDKVVHVAWPSDQQLLGATLGGVLYRWTLEEDRTEEFELSAAPLRSVAVSSVGAQVAVGDEHGQIRLLGPADGNLDQVASVVAHDGPVPALIWSPGGRVVASLAQDGHEPRLWGAADLKRILKGEGHAGGVRSATSASEATAVVTAGGDDRIGLWSGEGHLIGWLRVKDPQKVVPRGWKEVDQVYRLPLRDVSCASSGDHVVAAVDDRVWYWARPEPGTDGTVLASLGADVDWVGIDDEGERIVAGAGHYLWVARRTGEDWSVLVETQLDHPAVQGRFIGSTVMVLCDQNAVKRWHTDDGQFLDAVEAELDVALHEGPAALSKDGERGASCVDGLLRVWDTDNGKVLSTASSEDTTVLCWSPDGRHLAEGLDDGAIRIRDLQTEECHKLFGHEDRVTSLYWLADGTLLSSSVDSTCVRWTPLED